MARRKNTEEIKDTSLITFKGASIVGTTIKLVSTTSLIIFGKERSTGNYIAKSLLLVIVMSIMAMLALFIYGSTKWYLNDFCDSMTSNLHFYDLQLFHGVFDKHGSHGSRNAASIFISNAIAILYFSVLIVAPVLVGRNVNVRYWIIFGVVTISSFAWNGKVMSVNEKIKYSSSSNKLDKSNDVSYIDIDSIHHVTVLDIDKEIVEKQNKIRTHETLLAGKNEVKRKADVRNYNKKGKSQKNFDDAKYESELEELTIQTLVVELGTLRGVRKETIHNLNVINSEKKKEYQSGLTTASVLGYIGGFGMDGLFIILSSLCAFLLSELYVQDTSKFNLNASVTVKSIGSGLKVLTEGVPRLNKIKSGFDGIKSKYSKIKSGLNKIKTEKPKIKQKVEPSLFDNTEIKYSESEKEDLIKSLKSDRKYGEWHYSFMELLGSKIETGEYECWIDGIVFNQKSTLEIIADDLNIKSIATVKAHYTNQYLNKVGKGFDLLELQMFYQDAKRHRKGAMSV